MSLNAADYSFSRPSVASLKRAGVKAVGRYLNGAGKELSRGEAGALIKAGIDIWVVYEGEADAARQGGPRGARDADYAVSCALALGLRKGAALYFAVDFDASGPEVKDYAVSWSQVVRAHGYESGVYGGLRVVTYLKGNRIVRYAWQTAAWSGGQVWAHSDIYQGQVWTTSTPHSLDGQAVDWNTLLTRDYGGWQAVASPLLKRGSRGPAVRELKALLRKRGMRWLAPGDRYGSGCVRAVNLVKKRHGWPQDGICGARVWRVLTGK